MRYDPTLRQKKGRFYARFYDPRTRKRREHALGTRDIRTARRRLVDLIRRWEAGTFDPFADKARFGAQPVKTVLDTYLQDMAQRCKPGTVQDVRWILSAWLEMLPAGLDIRHVNEDDCGKLINRSSNPSTRRGYWRRGRAFLNWCVRQNYIPRNPMDTMTAPRNPKRQPAFLPVDEFERLRSYIYKHKPWLGPIVELAAYTGLRLGELRRLEWRDVDFHAGLLTVRDSGENKTRDSARTVPIYPKARDVLEILATWEDPERTEPVLLGPGGGVLHPNRTSRTFKACAVACGFEHIRFHDLRHTFASWLVMEGVPIYTVSRMLGHASVTTTEIYAHLSPEHRPDVEVLR